MRASQLWGGVGLWLAVAGCPAADDAPISDGAAPSAADANRDSTVQTPTRDAGAADKPGVMGLCAPSQAVNLASATATVDGKTVLLQPTCVRGERRQLIGFDISYYATFIAFRQSALDDYVTLSVQLNPDRKTAVATCDDHEVGGDMKGNGLVRFEATEIRDSSGRPAVMYSKRAGSFVITQYGDTVGSRIVGTFDCPIGPADGPARGSVKGDFDVRVE
jgi:hypothetical protein